MARFFCHYGKHEYDAMTPSGCCTVPSCFGEPLVDFSWTPDGDPEPQTGVLEGLCVLVCDISASMSTAAYPNNPSTRLTQVVSVMQQALGELQTMGRADAAYIAIVAFGQKAGLILDENDKPFIKSISEIMAQYGDRAERLGAYLLDYFEKDVGHFGRGGTNITAGLQVAKAIYDCTLSGDLRPLGISVTSRLIEHTDIISRDGRMLTMPNIRVLIYSDGGHTAGPTLTNPFYGMDPSPLITVFIGDANIDKTGSGQMAQIANICPEHQVSGYFLVDRPDKRAKLRNLFRMASGASGFCEQCADVSANEFTASH